MCDNSALTMSEDVVVIGGARTPFCEWLGGKRGDGEAGGRLAEVSAEQLGSIAIQVHLRRLEQVQSQSIT